MKDGLKPLALVVYGCGQPGADKEEILLDRFRL
jgi:hypothetical protein